MIRAMLISAGLSAILSAGASGILVYRYEQGRLAQFELADAKADAAAIAAAKNLQADQDKVSLDAAVTEATAQQKIVTQTVTITKEIPIHVSDTAHCITYGLVRVLNAAATQTGPDADAPGAGESDDTCAPVSWRSFAADLVDDYRSGNQNAEQLNGLEAWLNAQTSVAESPAAH